MGEKIVMVCHRKVLSSNIAGKETLGKKSTAAKFLRHDNGGANWDKPQSARLVQGR